MDPAEAVLAVNRRYYEAFEARDLDAMSDLWERSDRVLCTHPGWATLEGWGAVAASFFALFQGGQQLQFVLTRERVSVQGDTAWVSVDENLLGDQGGVTVATVNIFARRPGEDGPGEGGSGEGGSGEGGSGDGGWRMVCHHGSVIQAGAPRTSGTAG